MSKVCKGSAELHSLITDVCGMSATLSVRNEALEVQCPGYLPAGTQIKVFGTTAVMLDSQKDPINPLAGIESLALIEQLAMPELDLNAKILAVRMSDRGTFETRHWLTLCSDEVREDDFLMVVQHCNHVVPRGTVSDWQYINPALSVKDPAAVPSTQRNHWRLWYAASNVSGEAMEAWLIPFGYFGVTKTADGSFYHPVRGFKLTTIYDVYESEKNRFIKLYNAEMLRLEWGHEQCASELFDQKIQAAKRKQKLQQACEDLNARLNKIRQQEAFSNLPRFRVCDDESLKLIGDSSSRGYTISGAESYVHSLELKLQNYLKYRECFEKLRERIEAAEGTLDTEFSPTNAAVRFPVDQTKSEDGDIFKRRVFPFAEVGLSNLLTWLNVNERAQQKAREIIGMYAEFKNEK